ncbi:MAG: tetratricopeptide repeat protein, partial [Pyrinomonadaceae bacterium]|nr:tetratricopeptide repeat protein [Pyrinomonadaceae bacterium]
MNNIAQFCQKCRAANDPQASNCSDCGTPLMIVTFPKSLRHQEEITPSYYEDHLLERISVLEFRLAQLAEQLAMGYELISRQAKSAEEDHLMLRTFYESLEEIKPELSELFAREFSDVYLGKKKALETENRERKIFDETIAAHGRPNVELFTHLVKEGIALLNNGEEKQAFKMLERAILLSPKNAPLHLFTGERLFHSGEVKRALSLLDNAYKISPQNTKTLVLLGTIYAETRETEKARKFLSVLVGNPATSVCANYVWGMLAALEGSWQEALIAFRQASCETESAEFHYLLGCTEFELGEFQKALLFLEKAVALDTGFADASFMQSVIYEKTGELKLAKLCRETAFETKETGAVCLRFIDSKKNGKLPEYALPF